VPALLPAFDCLVNPSRTEGMAKAVIEAMFREVPVIATAVGGMPEVIADGRTGLLVPSRSPRATADAVERLIGDPALRRSLASAAREWVETHLSVAVAADRILEVYRGAEKGDVCNESSESQDPNGLPAGGSDGLCQRSRKWVGS
jgi:glycosyltransferase involved in cell wall biosynthesis